MMVSTLKAQSPPQCEYILNTVSLNTIYCLVKLGYRGKMLSVIDTPVQAYEKGITKEHVGTVGDSKALEGDQYARSHYQVTIPVPTPHQLTFVDNQFDVITGYLGIPLCPESAIK